MDSIKEINKINNINQMNNKLFIVKYKNYIIYSALISGLIILLVAIYLNLGIMIYAMIIFTVYFTIKLCLTASSLYKQIRIKNELKTKKVIR